MGCYSEIAEENLAGLREEYVGGCTYRESVERSLRVVRRRTLDISMNNSLTMEERKCNEDFSNDEDDVLFFNLA